MASDVLGGFDDSVISGSVDQHGAEKVDDFGTFGGFDDDKEKLAGDEDFEGFDDDDEEEIATGFGPLTAAAPAAGKQPKAGKEKEGAKALLSSVSTPPRNKDRPHGANTSPTHARKRPQPAPQHGAPQQAPGSAPSSPRMGPPRAPTSPKASPSPVQNGVRRPGPSLLPNGKRPLGTAANAPPIATKACACNLNRVLSSISQPFMAGVDMTTNTIVDVTGKALRRMYFNCQMTHPGSFKVEIRDEHCGAGKLLATEKGIVATSLFTKTVVDFEAQPELTSGKMYFLHVVLERGAFKFQACRGTKYPTYSYFGSNDKAWHPTALSYVMKPVYQKAIPRRGDKSGWLLVKVIQTKSERSRRVSLRKAAQKEMRKFAVLEGTVLTTFTNSTPSATEHKRINLKDVSNIAIKSGALDSKDFVIHLAKEEVHISATSASESKKWVKVLVRAKNLIVGAFGSATNASMIF